MSKENKRMRTSVYEILSSSANSEEIVTENNMGDFRNKDSSYVVEALTTVRVVTDGSMHHENECMKKETLKADTVSTLKTRGRKYLQLTLNIKN